MPDGGPDLPGDQRILLRRIVADQQKSRSRFQIAHGSENTTGSRSACQPGCKRHQTGIIRRAVMIHIVRAYRGPREASQQIILFVCRPIRTVKGDRVRAVLLMY